MKKEEQDIELKVIAGEQEDVAAEEEQLEEAQLANRKTLPLRKSSWRRRRKTPKCRR